MSDTEEESPASSQDSNHQMMCATAMMLCDQHRAAARAISIAIPIIFSDDRHAEDGDYSVNELRGKTDRLVHLQMGHSSIFKSMTGFTLSEWERLCLKVCPIIILHARHSGELKVKQGRPPKLCPPERLLSFILYVKHNNGARHEAIEWNYSRTSLNADSVFIASAVNLALSDEIEWPNAEKRSRLARVLPDFPGCIGHVDGTLCRINRPNIAEHKRYYNKRKAMYCFNNVIIVDHDGLIIYCEPAFTGSFHDVRCLRNSHIHLNWREYFRNDDLDVVQEYLLGDPGYMGVEMYILRRIDGREIQGDQANPVVRAFNKRHAAVRVQVEWGIGGLKNRWRRFLHTCPSRRDIFGVVFEACCRLTNFIHRSRMDFSMADLGPIGAQDGQDDGFVNEWGNQF